MTGKDPVLKDGRIVIPRGVKPAARGKTGTLVHVAIETHTRLRQMSAQTGMPMAKIIALLVGLADVDAPVVRARKEDSK